MVWSSTFALPRVVCVVWGEPHRAAQVCLERTVLADLNVGLDSETAFCPELCELLLGRGASLCVVSGESWLQASGGRVSPLC